MAKGENSEKDHQGWKTVLLKPAPAPTVSLSSPKTLSTKDTSVKKSVVRVRLGLDTSRPFPQANSLQKVVAVVDAVYREVETVPLPLL